MAGPYLLALALAGMAAGPEATDAAAATPAPSEVETEVQAEPAPKPAPEPEAEPPKKRRRFWMSNETTEEKRRRFLVGIEGVVMQAPPLRPSIVRVDPRFVGRTVALGGLGLFGRYRPVPIVAFDLSVRSGSLRLTDRDDDGVIAQDHVLAEAGVLLFVARGDVAQFAFDGGVGGAFNRVEYQPEGGPNGRQIFGSGLVRVGGDVEFVLKRVAIVLSLRAYGVFTDRDRVSEKGELFEDAPEPLRKAPVPTMQTWLVGSAGVAYRF
jgi:hypothetical protein